MTVAAERPRRSRRDQSCRWIGRTRRPVKVGTRQHLSPVGFERFILRWVPRRGLVSAGEPNANLEAIELQIA